MEEKEVELIFFRPCPEVDLPAEEIWKRHRLAGKWRRDGEDLLEPLPLEAVMVAIRALPDWEETEQDGPDRSTVCFHARPQPNDGSSVRFWVYWYGQKPGFERNHLLDLDCHNVTEEQMQSLIDLITGFDIPLQYREEHHFS